MILKTLTFVGALVLVCPTLALAQHQGSMEDQLACTPDVYRLCSSMIPDEDKIVACLERNKPTLSAACQKVFSAPNPGHSQSDTNDD
ncbi:cysteine rich repeat-containing protein [Lichenihabitans sp. PAMC28606]|uniref:cysteine rich repeat-containing protein n=1 Tax=Lichenihabitans sp. PAMC28606 TaxID=2880932 RepID=UPI001D0BC3B4|nr:cysteine rich repeat-containing protein [Lichenihabitans sp. PAMC28606]UDL95263.1 cysteine rich repeat-containing protein [Lichenihabitans sp. PAMC28606]